MLQICFLFLALSLQAREEVISGRKGDPLYRIEVPDTWVRTPLNVTDNTMEPLAEFKGEGVRMVIHNFPGRMIPPQAQIERWKKQSPQRLLEPAAFSGFQGLFFEGEKVLAWALEWGSSKQVSDEAASDVTIKVTGEVDRERPALIKAARSFELIEAPCEW